MTFCASCSRVGGPISTTDLSSSQLVGEAAGELALFFRGQSAMHGVQVDIYQVIATALTLASFRSLLAFSPQGEAFGSRVGQRPSAA
jgi:hypothetical protein